MLSTVSHLYMGPEVSSSSALSKLMLKQRMASVVVVLVIQACPTLSQYTR
jgi:hypothetical protein